MQARQLKARAAGSAPVFAALGDERRLLLLAQLCTDGPASITSLTAGAGISRQGITKHLQILSRAGLVRGTRNGREQIYEAEPKQLQQASEYLGIISRQWDQALSRLKTLAEDG